MSCGDETAQYDGGNIKMNFLFTCGGTAGHINPALAVAGRLRELMPDCGILFVGAEDRMETNLVPREGYEIKTVKITNISRAHTLEALGHNIGTLKNAMTSTREAKNIIRDFRPDAAVGTGGYVCYPVLKAAHELGIPTAVHESNAVPGLTTKMLAGSVDAVMVGFEESRELYPHPERVAVTGTPVRGEFGRYTKEKARAELGLAPDRPLVVSVWGSLGAGRMNEIMTEFITMAGRDSGFSLIHSAGSAGFAGMKEKLDSAFPDREKYGMDVREYIYDMPRVMAAADLIMCRSGASTLAELTYMGKPVILVPSPNVTNNHQEKNARVIENAGGAKVILEGELGAAELLDEVKGLLADKKTLSDMSDAMKSLAVPDAAERITEIVLGLCK
jgi:UDP-N-acetylglucosamine--N-acetylmuramyl-(pentapeptide) pyrophosphoryl-undecaprenol N-acetylglucosamine transferase